MYGVVAVPVLIGDEGRPTIEVPREDSGGWFRLVMLQGKSLRKWRLLGGVRGACWLFLHTINGRTEIAQTPVSLALPKDRSQGTEDQSGYLFRVIFGTYGTRRLKRPGVAIPPALAGADVGPEE